MAKPNSRDYVPVDLPDDPSGVSGATTDNSIAAPAAAAGAGAGAGSATEMTTTSATAQAAPSDAPAAAAASTAAPVIRINVRTLTGQQIECELPGGDAVATNTVADLKLAVEQVQGVPPSFQRLIFAGRELKDEQKLTEANIQHNNVVHLVLRQNAVAPAAARPAAADAAQPNANAAQLAAAAALGGGFMLGGGLGMPMPMPAHDPHRCLMAMQMARIVKLFSLVDGFFVVIWSLSYPWLIAMVLLCAAGWYGANKYRTRYVGLYLVYLLASIGFRLYLLIDKASNRSEVILMALSILVELYIFNLVVRFARLVNTLTAADMAELLPHDPHAAPVLPLVNNPAAAAAGGNGNGNGNGAQQN